MMTWEELILQAGIAKLTEREQLSQRACAEELKFILGNPLSRRFFWRLLTETLQIDVTSFPHNAAIYSLCGKQQAGKILLRAARVVDLDKTHLAEREYYDLQERLQRAAGNNGKEQDHE